MTVTEKQEQQGTVDSKNHLLFYKSEMSLTVRRLLTLTD